MFLLAAEGCLDLSREPENEDQASCTLIGCEDGVRIILNKTSAWMDGDYVFRFEADGHGTNCTATFPRDLPFEQEPKMLPCNPMHHVSISGSRACMEQQSGEGEATCGTEIERWTLETGTSSTPRKVIVSVMRDGEREFSKSVELKYMLVFPNGPECGPGCKLGIVDVTMD